MSTEHFFSAPFVIPACFSAAFPEDLLVVGEKSVRERERERERVREQERKRTKRNSTTASYYTAFPVSQSVRMRCNVTSQVHSFRNGISDGE
jgi:hypothetical protein